MKYLQHKTYLILFIIYLINSNLYAQDSTELQNVNTEEIEFSIDSLNNEARKVWKNEHFDNAASLLVQVLQLNQAMDNKKAIAKTCNKLGFMYLRISDDSRAYSYFKNALEIVKQKKLKCNTIYTQLNLAYVSLQQDDADRMLIYLNDILSTVFSTGDSSLIKRTYGLTALYYEKVGESDKALDYYRKYEEITYAIFEKHRSTFWRNNWKDIILDSETNLLDDKIKFALHYLQLKEKDARFLQVQKVKNILTSGIVVNVIILIVLFYLLIDRIRDNKTLNHKNIEIEQQKEELLAQKDKLSNQNKNITASINYALTIQNASLPSKNVIAKGLDFGIFYKPKDIVSGDFYWYHEIFDECKFIAVVDSTGHGVPGAFMSLIGIQLLNEIVIEKGIHEPAQILDYLNKGLSKALKQHTSENEDGMDVCLCKIEKKTDFTKIVFAGAKRPLYYYSIGNNSFETIQGNSSSTGGRYAKKDNIEYKQTELNVLTGDCIVLSSDGIIDQPVLYNKKYGSQRLLETIKANVSFPAEVQIKQLITDFSLALGEEVQRDDISVMIIKF